MSRHWVTLVIPEHLTVQHVMCRAGNRAAKDLNKRLWQGAERIYRDAMRHLPEYSVDDEGWIREQLVS